MPIRPRRYLDLGLPTRATGSQERPSSPMLGYEAARRVGGGEQALQVLEVPVPFLPECIPFSMSGTITTGTTSTFNSAVNCTYSGIVRSVTAQAFTAAGVAVTGLYKINVSQSGRNQLNQGEGCSLQDLLPTRAAVMQYAYEVVQGIGFTVSAQNPTAADAILVVTVWIEPTSQTPNGCATA